MWNGSKGGSKVNVQDAGSLLQRMSPSFLFAGTRGMGSARHEAFPAQGTAVRAEVESCCERLSVFRDVVVDVFLLCCFVLFLSFCSSLLCG